MYNEYTREQMAKMTYIQNERERRQDETRGRRYVDLNRSIFDLQYDEDFMALAYSTARIW